MTGSLLLCSDDRFGSWLCKNADVRKTDGRIISPIANFVARILMRDRIDFACVPKLPFASQELPGW
jgi:hypothetical protein